MKNLLLVLLLLPSVVFGALAADKQDLPQINLLQNVGFENGQAKWKKSAGGTWAVVTSGSNLLVDSASLTFDAASSGDYVESVSYTVPESLKGKPCLASVEQKGADSNLELRVLDGSNTVLAQVGLASSNKIGFLCPTSGSIKLRVHAIGNAAAVALDKAHLGESSELVQLSQARIVGTIVVNGCSTYWSTSSASLASLGTQTGCTYTVTGEALQPSTNIAGFKFASLPAGEYKIEYEGFWGMTASNDGKLQFTDGTITARELSSMSGLTGQINSVSQSFTYSSQQSNVTWQLFGSAGSGSLLVGGTNIYPATFRLYYFPSQSQLALNSVNSNFGWTDGGAVTIEATTTNPTKGTVNTDKFWYKKSGDSGEFRIEYSQTTGGSAGSGDYIFKLPNGLQFDLTKVTAYSTVVGTGTVQAAKNSVGSCMASSLTYPTNLVGIAVVYDATHVRCLGTDITSNGSISSGFYQITDNASYAFSFKAPILGWFESELNMPVIVGGVSTGSSGAMRIESATIANNGTCSIASQSSNWISSVNHVGAGGCEVNFVGGTFSSTPVCSFNSLGGGRSFVHSGSNTATQLAYVENYRADTDTTPDADFTMMCIGPK